jgi:hypothetical protein
LHDKSSQEAHRLSSIARLVSDQQNHTIQVGAEIIFSKAKTGIEQPTKQVTEGTRLGPASLVLRGTNVPGVKIAWS